MFDLYVRKCECCIKSNVRMVFSDYTKQRILSLHWQGHKVPAIVECLVLEGGIRVLRVGVWRFIKSYNMRGTITRQPSSGSSQKLTLKSKLLLRRV